MGPPPAALGLPVTNLPLPFPKFDASDKRWTAFRDPAVVNGGRGVKTDMGSVINGIQHSLAIKEEVKVEIKEYSISETEREEPPQSPPIPCLLPRIQLEMSYVDDDFALQFAEQSPYSNFTLAWALQQSFSSEAIRKYISSYEPKDVRAVIGLATVQGYPVLFYAVERNCAKTVRLLLELGCSPTARSLLYNVPVLGFAILHAENELLNTTDVVTTLLGLGADPTQVPNDMFTDYLRAPKGQRKQGIKKDQDPEPGWCIPEFRAALARTLNLTQRYFLAKAHRLKPPSGRAKQVAVAHKVTALFEAPYHLVGQAPATNMVLSRVFGHIALCANTPLVLLYAGPSGHGKTELAKQMGTLMSLETLIVDCTEMKYETDMFGPKAPYVGSAEGSPLNNYLAQQSGRRSIVFLDEFEKTTDAVRRALLLAFDSGIYNDRRNGKSLDCTRTIWVLATNMAESTIVKFYKTHMQDKSEAEQAKAPLSVLDSMLKKEFTAAMGAPLTGRFTLIVPFFPFSPNEQAVVVHKFILDFRDNIRRPIDLLENRLVGHIHLELGIQDGKISSWLAEMGYEEALGARSLQRVVQQLVHSKLADRYLEGDEVITEFVNDGGLQVYRIKLIKGEGAVEELVVEKIGVLDRGIERVIGVGSTILTMPGEFEIL
ncbi:MAG: hypothetical protein M1812_007660 [Candelaria pacifica]|nr:MAG: hypothetical protein M1812_007660 [Candelaria pacifica]